MSEVHLGQIGWIITPAEAITSYYSPARICHITRTRFVAEYPTGRRVEFRKSDLREHGGRKLWSSVKPEPARHLQLSAQAKGREYW